MSRLTLTVLATLALAITLWMAGSAMAGHGGHGGYGGHGGGYHGGGYHGGGFNHLGYGIGIGFYPGYRPGYGNGYSGYGVSPIYTTNYTQIVDPGQTAIIRQLSYTPEPSAPDNKAHIHVLLPADAALWFDGEATTKTGLERDFVSPELAPDKAFTYELKARWMQGGVPVEKTLKVKVRRNTTSVADFNELPPPKD